MAKEKNAPRIRDRLHFEDFFTIPNILSYIRILLVPAIVYFYAVKQEYLIATAMVFVSGLTDVADGFIARKFNMITDFGKFIDPVADKLTQLGLIVCIAINHVWMYALVALMVVKESTQFILGLITFKKNDVVNSAKWYGKVCTAVIYGSMIILFLFPTIENIYADIIGAICGGVMIMAFVLYCRMFYLILTKDNKEPKEVTA